LLEQSQQLRQLRGTQRPLTQLGPTQLRLLGKRDLHCLSFWQQNDLGPLLHLFDDEDEQLGPSHND
jgi:hypothetical protein